MSASEQSAQLQSMSRRSVVKLLTVTPLLPFVSLGSIRVADPSGGSQVTTLPCGVSFYEFITPAVTAPLVGEGSLVSVHYTLGTTGARNGWRIDSSYDRAPLTFKVGKGEVVEGLDVGVVGMRLGGKRRIVIPSALGYKTKDDRPVVMGFAEWQRFKNIYLNKDRVYKPDLVMDVTVVKIQNVS